MKKITLLFYFITAFFIKNAFATTLYVATTGNDATGTGTITAPYKTLGYAVSLAQANDIILMRGGIYNVTNEVRIDVNNLTIKSYPNEWARIIGAVNDENNMSFPIWFHEPTIVGGTLENLEIIGGFYYAIKLETDWDYDFTIPYANRHGCQNITLRNLKIHHTGRDGIKITPGCKNILIESCEIYNTGVGPSAMQDLNAEGVDCVNGTNVTVQNCYFHDIATNGFYFKGGSTNCIAQYNLIRNTQEAGIGLGFYTDADWFNPDINPEYYECVGCKAINNYVINTKGAGIGAWGCKNCEIAHNTVINTASDFHTPLFFNRGEIYLDATTVFNPNNLNMKVQNNIFFQNSADTTRYMVGVRDSSLRGNTIIDYNLFFKTGANQLYAYDNLNNDPTLSQWNSMMGFNAHSIISNPNFNTNYHLNTSSPAINTGINANINTDYDHNTRTGTPDIGADEFGGTALNVPPTSGVIGTGFVSTEVFNTPQTFDFIINNLVKDQLIVTIDDYLINKSYFIANMEGKILKNGLLLQNNTQILINEIPAGIYTITIFEKNQQSAKKFIKI